MLVDKRWNVRALELLAKRRLRAVDNHQIRLERQNPLGVRIDQPADAGKLVRLRRKPIEAAEALCPKDTRCYEMVKAIDASNPGQAPGHLCAALAEHAADAFAPEHVENVRQVNAIGSVDDVTKRALAALRGT